MKKENRLPEKWCVLNDDSQRFKDTVVKWLNENHNAKNSGSSIGYYYGSRYISKNPYGTILTIDQFVELTTTKEELIAMYEAKIAELKKPVYEVGRWYINQYGAMCKYVSPGKHYGVGAYNIWCTDLDWFEGNTCIWAPAAHDQIKSKLENCAINTGYTVTNFKCLSGIQFKPLNSEFLYNKGSDTLYMGRNSCYCNGQWATIIKEQPLVINGYEVVVKDGYVQIDELSLTKEYLSGLLKCMNVFSAMRTDSGFELTKSDIEKIIKLLEK